MHLQLLGLPESLVILLISVSVVEQVLLGLTGCRTPSTSVTTLLLMRRRYL